MVPSPRRLWYAEVVAFSSMCSRVAGPQLPGTASARAWVARLVRNAILPSSHWCATSYSQVHSTVVMKLLISVNHLSLCDEAD